MSDSIKHPNTADNQELEDLEMDEAALRVLGAEDAEGIHGGGTTTPTQKTTTSTTKPFEITDFSFGTGN